jgi:ABC-type branched-subunit amino acid transport system substrate-binding protein
VEIVTRIDRRAAFVMGLSAIFLSALAKADGKYDPGASDTEIKIGNIVPYSGPASAYGLIGKVEAAYFRMINDQGGINGRKINFISYDDAYSPPKTVEQARKLVESDEVLLVFSAQGTPTNSAIQRYLNNKKIPQLFISSGATKWDDPKNFPWSMGHGPSYRTEGTVFAKYILQEKPTAKIAILYQGDDFGKDLTKSFLDGLGDKRSMVVAQSAYDVGEPTIESHIVRLKSSGADVIVSFATPKFAAQSIKRVGELGWNAHHLVMSQSTSITEVITPAGFKNAQGVVSATYFKDVADPQWKNDAGMKRFLDFMDRYMPGVDKNDSILLLGYGKAQTLEQVLRQSGNDLTRENVMRQAASLSNVGLDILLPGITVNTSQTKYSPVDQMHLMRFNGGKWELFGGLQQADKM